MIIESRSLWVAATNCYVVGAEPGGPAVVIDAPPDVDAIVALLRTADLVPTALLVTHGHVDHVGGAGAFARKSGVTAYLHPDDDWLAQAPDVQLRALFGMTPEGDFAPPERFDPLADATVIAAAGLEFEALHTPGHTPGHCCFHLPDEGILFSGDQLFAGSIGRTDLPGGDYATLMRSMADKILVLPDDTEVLPGHGPATTLARERRVNPFLQELL
jgi:glyoxylase-like metal-dependent hydrolase (beta-lactamase superfamily II)